MCMLRVSEFEMNKAAAWGGRGSQLKSVALAVKVSSVIWRIYEDSTGAKARPANFKHWKILRFTKKQKLIHTIKWIYMCTYCCKQPQKSWVSQQNLESWQAWKAARESFKVFVCKLWATASWGEEKILMNRISGIVVKRATSSMFVGALSVVNLCMNWRQW